MTNNIRSNRLYFVMAVWAIGLILFIALGIWNINIGQKNTEDRLLGEAGRIASQLASLLSLPNGEPDGFTARAVVAGAMEDENIYAVKIENRHGMKEGRRRNYLWEPILWDDEVIENCIQGMTPLKYDGKTIGSVEVWLSPRQIEEEETQIFEHESLRLIILAVFWSASIFLLLWHWGEFHRLKKQFAENKNTPKAAETSDNSQIVLGLSPQNEYNSNEFSSEIPACDQIKGRKFQRKNPDSWLVTAGLFRQTFLRGPELMSRLYANGEFAGLCHLGRILEKAAPCLGATRLLQAAQDMQAALNNPESKERASSVEECVNALEEVLVSLTGETK